MPIPTNYFRLIYLFYALCVIFPISAVAAQTHTIQINNNQEIEFSYQQPNKNTGDTLLLVIPSEHGTQKAEKNLLDTLPMQSIEVWICNLLESYFLPNTASNLEKIPAIDIQQIIKRLHKKTNKKIIILTTGRGSIPVLRALASWPNKVSPPYITGLILMHPKLFTKTPSPGSIAEVMPSVRKTNQLIYFIQPNQSPFWWNRNISLSGLQQSGSDIYIHSLKNIRNRYYFRADATSYEQQLAAQFPHLIYNAINQIKRYPSKQRMLAKNYKAKPIVTTVKSHRTLSKYKGSPIPPNLNLQSLNGNVYKLQNDTGNVLLVNFWASWCPPCVHEMPSMQTLYNKLNKSSDKVFKIIAVNMAEDKNTINTFLKTKVSVNFDILLDTDGAALKQWKIFAFPTSFIIDKKGKIRYSIYGAIDWLNPDVTHKIQLLINE